MTEQHSSGNHGDLANSLKNAWEDAKTGGKKTYVDFEKEFNKRYNDASTWSKSNKEEDKLKARDAKAKYEADWKEAKDKGQNRLAYYYEQAKNSLGMN